MAKKRKQRIKGEVIPLHDIVPPAKGRSREDTRMPKHTAREQIAHELIVAVSRILGDKL